MKQIGFIGLGTMGAPMASNLLRAGFQVTVYNRTAAKCDPLVTEGATAAASLQAASEGKDVIITMVSNDDSIREIYYGPEGILEALKPGAIVIDSSTISPGLVKEIAAAFENKGGHFLDAPVTGSKPGAVEGTLVFMVGGSADVIEASRDVFDAMGKLLLHMGENGSGAAAKLAHNAMVGIHNIALAEGFSIAVKSGVPADKFLELIRNGSAGSKQVELKGRKIIESDFSNQFSLGLMLKDLKLATALSDASGVPTPALELAKSLFQAGYNSGSGEEDLSAVVKTYEAWIGRKIGE
ncbi:NAD(P)-dependent oxidoreductase [Paenibacillus sp. 7124]|uniref:NAD(P)-dependent oxidoreductase n=1 Tax=Paenibacillus apii TaxID=1850370 RepID=A0A6M1PGM4_9BACL|nr:NAD(P)-dependent oxidoreductase [Paenibacillus apii]NGM82629.1 NAD(P)-dependent oxidoreductase [Paenibacillus apii]